MVTINASAPIPACAAGSDTGDIPFSLYNLPLGLHNVRWDSGPVGENDQVIFWGIDGERPADGTGMTNITIDNTYARDGGIEFRFDGAWEQKSAGDSGGENMEGNFNKTLATTSKLGASVSFTGTGESQLSIKADIRLCGIRIWNRWTRSWYRFPQLEWERRRVKDELDIAMEYAISVVVVWGWVGYRDSD